MGKAHQVEDRRHLPQYFPPGSLHHLHGKGNILVDGLLGQEAEILKYDTYPLR